MNNTNESPLSTLKIKNRKQLVDNAESRLLRKERTMALRSLEFVLNFIDPRKLTKTQINLENKKLKAGSHTFDLKRVRDIYVVGGGKAGGKMAEACEEILGNLITDGAVNVPHGDKTKTSFIKLHEANHPIPDEAGLEGTRRIMEIAGRAGSDDLIICLISGGGSSLMPLPREGLSLVDKIELTSALLKSGARISEINAVRKHVSAFKGGWLAKRAYPATVLNLVLSDVVGDGLEFVASGPTLPDSSTFPDARIVLERYGLWNGTPTSVRRVLLDGQKGLIEETPKKDDIVFEKVYNVVVGNSRTAASAACQYLENAGLNTILLTSTLEGEARHVGTMLGTIANEIGATGNPVARPAAVVASGETTVTVIGNGVGGRNQELALSAALKLDAAGRAVVASLSTDGVDGPTTAAGAVVDGKTLGHAAQLGIDASTYLVENNSYNFFSRIGDLIVTGPTGTNVNDISLLIIL